MKNLNYLTFVRAGSRRGPRLKDITFLFTDTV